MVCIGPHRPIYLQDCASIPQSSNLPACTWCVDQRWSGKNEVESWLRRTSAGSSVYSLLATGYSWKGLIHDSHCIANTLQLQIRMRVLSTIKLLLPIRHAALAPTHPSNAVSAPKHIEREGRLQHWNTYASRSRPKKPQKFPPLSSLCH